MQNIRNFLTPHPPQDWTAAEIRKANRLVSPIQSLYTIFFTSAIMGSVLYIGGQIVRKLTGIVLPFCHRLFAVTALALYILSRCFLYLTNRHYAGLSDEKRLSIAMEELKPAFRELPVCRTEAELKHKLKTDADFNYDTAEEAVQAVNYLLHMARPRYCPTKEIVPRFDISQCGTTEEQKQELLDIAFEKGILLRFNDFFSYLITEKLPERFDKKGLSPSALSKMLESHVASVNFLFNRLQKFDASKIKEINDQLHALAFRFNKDDKIHVVNPTIYLEDEETVVIRGNCSEIGHPAFDIEKLAPYIKNIKVERQGILSSIANGKSLLNPRNWEEFQHTLNARFPGKLIFVETLDSMPDIWQNEETYVFRELSFRDRLDAALEDTQRVINLKKQQQSK